MHEHHDRAIYRRRRITLALILVALIALVWLLVTRLSDDDDGSTSADPSQVASSSPTSDATSPDTIGPETSPPETAAIETSAPDTSPATTTPATTTPATTTPETTISETTASTALSTTAAPTTAVTELPATTAPVTAPATTPATTATTAAEVTPVATDAGTVAPTTEAAVVTVVETSVATSAPDTPPNEVTVDIDEDRAELTGLIGSADAVALISGMVDQIVPGTPIEDRTFLDDTIDTGDLTVVIEDLRGVGFDRDVYDVVNDELAETLDGVAAVLEEFPDTNLVLIGHAITAGDDAVDRAAAIERADAGRDYLVELGIDEDRLGTLGAGEDGTFPTSNETSINRRLDYLISGLTTG